MDEKVRNAEYNQATGDLVEMMSKDADPRFRNSKFLDFLKKVNSGEYELTQNNQLIEHPEKAEATKLSTLYNYLTSR